MPTDIDTFTLDELLLALSGAAVEDTQDCGVTMRQLREVTGRTELALARDLRRLIDAGRIECVRIWYTRIDGVKTRVPSYRVKREE